MNLDNPKRKATEQAHPNRFEVRWSNGEWGVFDTIAYRMVERVRPNTYKRVMEVFNA